MVEVIFFWWRAQVSIFVLGLSNPWQGAVNFWENMVSQAFPDVCYLIFLRSARLMVLTDMMHFNWINLVCWGHPRHSAGFDTNGILAIQQQMTVCKMMKIMKVDGPCWYVPSRKCDCKLKCGIQRWWSWSWNNILSMYEITGFNPPGLVGPGGL